MIYYTGDLHLGHANIIRTCERPFSSVEDMNETLIRNWNRKVGNGDTVYIIGDLMFRAADSPESYLTALKGHKHLLIGNHDASWMKHVDAVKYFDSIENLLEIMDGNRFGTLCHYPMMSSYHRGRGAYMVFGHLHQNTNAGYWPLIHDDERMLNAGVDVNHYEPVTLDEMIANNQRFKSDFSGEDG